MTKRCLIPSLLVLWTASSKAQQYWNHQPETHGSAAIYLDNDALGGQDRDYTNGLRFAWLSGKLDDSDRVLKGLSEVLTPESKRILSKGEEEVAHHFGISLTQLMFTPDDKESFVQPDGQRRYAGWLGLGVSLHARTGDVLNSVEFVIGTTGPNSQAETLQDLFHSTGERTKFNGWDDQIPNEITADVILNQKRQFEFQSLSHGDFSMDGIVDWGARLGTFRTSAHVGFQIRGGLNLEADFSDPRLADTAYAHAISDKTADWSPYFILGAAVRGIAHDATLDGPLFHDFETGNDRRPFVAEVFGGVGVRYKNLEINYLHTLRSKEYDEQSKMSDFGSFMINYRF